MLKPHHCVYRPISRCWCAPVPSALRSSVQTLAEPSWRSVRGRYGMADVRRPSWRGFRSSCSAPIVCMSAWHLCLLTTIIGVCSGTCTHDQHNRSRHTYTSISEFILFVAELNNRYRIVLPVRAYYSQPILREVIVNIYIYRMCHRAGNIVFFAFEPLGLTHGANPIWPSACKCYI